MKVKILSLRPTQISAGMREIRHRVEKLSKMSKKERHDYLAERIVPCVKGPEKRLYMIDHHHLTRALWNMNYEETNAHVIADLSKLTVKAFWKRMTKEGWVYPYDQYGNGPYNPILYLPETIEGLADDPWRGVAWLAREAGAYKKVQAPFVEFQWANFLRTTMNTHPNTHDIVDVLAEAVRRCKSDAAKKLNLPGVIT